MRNRLLVASMLAMALPGAALAQPADPNCVRSNHDSRVEGTVLGAVGGAVVGGLLGRGTGAAIGGLGGAVAGNAIAGSRNQPCPSGYYYAQPPAQGYAPPPNQGYAPQSGQGYDNRGDRGGDYRRGDDHRADDHRGDERRADDRGPGYGPSAYAPSPEAGRFWNDAPGEVSQRIDFMNDRLHHAADEGRLNRRQARRAFTELRSIRTWAHNRMQRENGLSPDDQAYVQARLDHLGASVHWMEQTGY